MTVERRVDGQAPATVAKKRKLSKRTVKVMVWATGAVAFVLPWVAIQAVPRPTVTAGPQLVVVPSGGHVVISLAPGCGSGGVAVSTGGQGGAVTGATVTTPAVATTGGSAPPPPGA